MSAFVTHALEAGKLPTCPTALDRSLSARIYWMYVPASFAEHDREKLFDFIEGHSFGVLYSQHAGHPFASHLPFLVERTAMPAGHLVGHMARANPQWRDFDARNGSEASEVLVVFSGPHAYISPTWYEEQEVVPTWNYIAVHVSGRLTLVHDDESLGRIVSDSVNVYERSMPRPWTVDARAEFVQRMLKQIIGFRIEITRIEGKWKLGQNHSRERRERVVRQLKQFSHDDSREIASAMERTYD